MAQKQHKHDWQMEWRDCPAPRKGRQEVLVCKECKKVREFKDEGVLIATIPLDIFDGDL
jgi:Fe2+ or Zn2+ uptake regulation protein